MEPEWLKQAREKGLVNDKATLKTNVEKIQPVAELESGLCEAKFQQQIVELAEANQWKHAHCRKVLVKMGQTFHYETPMAKGWFDLVLVREVTLFVEAKVGKNRQTPEQIEWAKAMELAGQLTYVWYPSDWRAILAIITRKPPKRWLERKAQCTPQCDG